MIHYMHQNSNEPANIELDYAMQTYINIYTFCPSTYSFNFIWLFCCFFFCEVCVTLLCPHSGRSETVSFFEFEFAFITMQWICKKERTWCGLSVSYTFTLKGIQLTAVICFSLFYDKSHTKQITQWFRSNKRGCSNFQKNTYASYASCCNTSYEDNSYIFMVTAMTMIHLISHMNLIHQVISAWFIWSSKWEPENFCNNLRKTNRNGRCE